MRRIIDLKGTKRNLPLFLKTVLAQRHLGWFERGVLEEVGLRGDGEYYREEMSR
jgi:hypothetical protein